MIYINSQGGCKGDMCPRSNSSRLNSSFFFFSFSFLWQWTGRGNANAHTRGRSLLVLLQDIQLLRTLSTHGFSGGMWRPREENETYGVINLVPCAELTALAGWSISQSAHSFRHRTFQWKSMVIKLDRQSSVFFIFFCLVRQLFLCNVVPTIDHVVNHRSCQTSNNRLWGNEKRRAGL